MTEADKMYEDLKNDCGPELWQEVNDFWSNMNLEIDKKPKQEKSWSIDEMLEMFDRPDWIEYNGIKL